MGTWSTAIKDNDAFADIYSEFFDLYNEGNQPSLISKQLFEEYQEILSIPEEKNNLWFAIALAQWETKSLDPKILDKVKDIINTEADLQIWINLGASEQDIKKRAIALNKFLEKLNSERPRPKPRHKPKSKTPIFSTGDCLTFKLSNGNFGGAVVLASDSNPKTGYNLVATTRINQVSKPDIKDFKNSEVLVRNFGNWTDQPAVIWITPDLYSKKYSGLYEVVCRLAIELEYEANDHEGKKYLFRPSYSSGWNMRDMLEEQIKSEISKPKPLKNITIQQLIKKNRLFNLF